MNKQAPKKAIVVPIERGRRRRAKAAAIAEHHTARKRLSPLAALLAGLVGLSSLALVIRAVVLRSAATGGLAAATGSGMAILVGLVGLAVLAYLKRGDFTRRVRPGSGSGRRGSRSGAFRF